MTEHLPVAVELADAPDPAARDAILGPLLAYNQALLGPADTRPLALLLRGADGSVTGGLWGRTSYRWLFVELLFVPADRRGQGLGAELLGLAEAEAKRRECLGAWLDTFNAAARVFYEKHGYRLFGEISDYPPGSGRHFLAKRFGP
jgi:GNAT superfamily N-acetyltransferase